MSLTTAAPVRLRSSNARRRRARARERGRGLRPPSATPPRVSSSGRDDRQCGLAGEPSAADNWVTRRGEGFEPVDRRLDKVSLRGRNALLEFGTGSRPEPDRRGLCPAVEVLAEVVARFRWRVRSGDGPFEASGWRHCLAGSRRSARSISVHGGRPISYRFRNRPPRPRTRSSDVRRRIGFTEAGFNATARARGR